MRLLAARDALADGRQQRRRDDAALGLVVHVHPAHRGQAARLTCRAGADALAHVQAQVAAGSSPASSPATAWPSPAARGRRRADGLCRGFPAGRGTPPGRAPSSARLPAACSSGRVPRRPRSGAASASTRTPPCACPARCAPGPMCAASQLLRRCAGVMPLCIDTTRSRPRWAKRASKRACSCGVRLISGTITSTCASGSCASTLAAARR